MKDKEAYSVEKPVEEATKGRIRLVKRLLRSRKYREAEQLFVAEGVRLCEMAASSGWGIRFGLFSDQGRQVPRAAALLDRLEALGVSLQYLSPRAYAELSETETPQGVLLVMERSVSSPGELPAVPCPLYAVLDGLQEPGNVGAVLRNADAAGLDGVLLLRGSADPFSGKAVRASMGSLFHLPLCVDLTREELLTFCRQRALRIWATALDAAALPHTQGDLHLPGAVVFGNEGNGVSRELLTLDGVQSLYIPLYGQAESLNVAAASAVLFYEAIRQRQRIS